MRRASTTGGVRTRHSRTTEKSLEQAAQRHTTVVERIFGQQQSKVATHTKTAFEKDAWSPTSPRKSRRATTPTKTNRSVNLTQGKDEEHEWSVCADDYSNVPTGDDTDKRNVKKDKPVILKEGDAIEVNGVILRLSSAMDGHYGFVEIYEESNETFCLHFESTLNCKKKRLKIGCLIHVLAAASNKTHVLRLLQRGTDSTLHIRYFITDAYGPTISDLQAKRANKRFTVGTATRLAIETLKAIEELHTMGYIHRDLRPTSFIIGRGSFENHIYIINFKWVRKFRTKDGRIIPRRSYVPFVSSAKYASRACHDRLDSSRKDDLESWMFMSVEFYHINILSWRGMNNLAEIRKEKGNFMTERGIKSLQIECQTLPSKLLSVFNEITSMNFESAPNYENIKDVFKKQLGSRNYKIKAKWDWALTGTMSNESVEHVGGEN